MNGTELAKAFYEELGAPMLKRDFPETEKYIAAALVGSGSECFGYDDEISRDHDFEPGFCLFIPGEDVIDSRTAFRLERAYAKLPREFMGFKRSAVSPVGGNRHGVLRIDEFYLAKAGTRDGVLSAQAWLSVPEYALAEATNGVVFCDSYGLFTEIRRRLLDMPQDIRLKKLAGNLLIMAQAGQYNFGRCIKRADTAAAQLAAIEFAKSAMHAVFILNEKYMPYYKWSFRAMRDLSLLSELAEPLEMLISSGNTEELARQKLAVIEEIAAKIIDELKRRNITAAVCGDLEKHAYSVNDSVRDANIRNMHILCAV